MQRGVAVHDVSNINGRHACTHARAMTDGRAAHSPHKLLILVYRLGVVCGVGVCGVRTWIAALRHGATESDLDVLLSAVQPIIDQLMGRHALYEWTLLQLRQACL
jgi:hypothetical protein